MLLSFTSSLFNRVCGKSCCGPCSSKTVASDTPSSSSSSADNKHRCCDSCYNMLRYSTYGQYTKPVVNSTIKLQTSSSSNKSLHADDDSKKQTQELFGNADKKRSSDDKSIVAQKAGSSTGKLQQTMSEINDNMALRGEKLNSLGDKSDMLLDSASQFEAMAKALQQQQSSKWW
jgi:Synaptobrevin